MRFFEVVLSGAALIAAAWAVEFNEVPSTIEAGKSYTITYSPKDNTPTTLILRKGDPDDLGTIATLTTSATGGSFTWTVPSTLVNAKDYALEIVQSGGTPNYSGLIALTGGSASSSGTPTPTPSKTSSTTSGSTTKTDSSTLTSSTVSGTISSTPGTNSTVTTPPLSRTSSTGSSSTTTGGPPQQTTNAAAYLGSSPAALLFGAVAAMAYLN